MDAWIIFVALLLPTFVLNMLSAGRDQLLFQTRPAVRHSVVALLVLAAVVVLLWLGMSLAWALALALPGAIGSALGRWVGSGDWLVLRFRIERLLGRR